MEWIIFASLAAIGYGIFDLLVKQAAGKIEDGLSGLIINGIAAAVLLAFVLFEKFIRRTELFTTSTGIWLSVAAGVVIGIVTILFIKMFATGVNLSTGVAIVRAGMIVVATLLAVLILGEKLEPRQLVGVVIVILGLGLILLK